MPSSKSADGSFTLYYSTDGGPVNLTVGFYLAGARIDQLKVWNFGDGTQEGPDHDLVKNHMYSSIAVGNRTISVTVKDPTTLETIATITAPITIFPNPKSMLISNFYQTEGVIIQNSTVGISISSAITPYDIIWEWDIDDAGELPVHDKCPNPDHEYITYNTDYSPYKGRVTVVGNNDEKLEWNFATMVLPDPTKLVIGNIGIYSMSPSGSAIIEVGSPVVFTANLSGGPGLPPGFEYDYVWIVTKPDWDTGALPSPIQNGVQMKCTFDHPQNFLVTCHILIKDIVHPTSSSIPYLTVQTSVNVKKKS